MQIFERQISSADPIDVDIICPKCGNHIIDILRLPRGNGRGWWGDQQGRARCVRCGETFEICFAEED